jgi:hypothetical protein
MDSEPLRDLSVDLFEEELQELDRPMALVAFADDKPGSNIERGKKLARTMSHVAVRATFRYVRHHRQEALAELDIGSIKQLLERCLARREWKLREILAVEVEQIECDHHDLL